MSSRTNYFLTRNKVNHFLPYCRKICLVSIEFISTNIDHIITLSYVSYWRSISVTAWRGNKYGTMFPLQVTNFVFYTFFEFSNPNGMDTVWTLTRFSCRGDLRPSKFSVQQTISWAWGATPPGNFPAYELPTVMAAQSVPWPFTCRSVMSFWSWSELKFLEKSGARRTLA